MSPETALTELRSGLELALTIGMPMLLTVLTVGLIVGVAQAATQINEQTIAFVAKALALSALIAATGSWMLGQLVDYTRDLLLRIPSLVG